MTTTLKRSSQVLALAACFGIGLGSTPAEASWLSKAARNVSNTVQKAKDDTVRTIDKAKDDTVTAIEKAVDDTTETLEKAGQDIEAEAHRNPEITTAAVVVAMVATSVATGIPLVPVAP